jgi:hypothetical protein
MSAAASAIVVYDAFTGRETQFRPIRGSRLPARFDDVKFQASRRRIYLTVVAGGRLTLLDFEHQTLADATVEGVPTDAYTALGTLGGQQVLAILCPYKPRLCDATSGKDQIAPIRTSPTARAVAFARLGQRDIVLAALRHHPGVEPVHRPDAQAATARDQPRRHGRPLLSERHRARRHRRPGPAAYPAARG